MKNGEAELKSEKCDALITGLQKRAAEQDSEVKKMQENYPGMRNKGEQIIESLCERPRETKTCGETEKNETGIMFRHRRNHKEKQQTEREI